MSAYAASPLLPIPEEVAGARYERYHMLYLALDYQFFQMLDPHTNEMGYVLDVAWAVLALGKEYGILHI